MIQSRVTALCIGCIASLSFGFAACTQKHAYRVPEQRVQTSILEIRDNAEHRAEVERHSVEEHPDFAVAFVEFKDNGQLHDPTQVDRAEKLILEEAGGEQGPGAVVVVFVHGWKHNASVCDENVVCFREVLTGLDNLERVQAAQSGNVPRRIVGVYIGWRGLSVKTKILKEFTFYRRKATAHRIGRAGEVLDVFQRLEATRDQLNATADRSRLIIIGHSFGGALIFSAVAGLFEERLANSPEGTPVEGVGDLVVLVNPAFEAARYSTIEEMAVARPESDTPQPATLVTVTSQSDTATRKAFPIGRRISTMFAWAWPKDKKKQKRTAVGHHLPFRTHFMEPAASRGQLLPDVVERTEAEARGASDCRCSYIEVGSLSASEIEIAADTVDPAAMAFTGVDLRSIRPDNLATNPFIMIGTTDEVVTEHNGIYNRVFVDFLRSFVIQMERLKAEDHANE